MFILFESAVGLSLLYCFYYFFLRNGNDFRFQRLYLILTGVISVIIPLLNIRVPSDAIPLSGQFLLFQEEYIDFSGQIKEGLYANHSSLDLPVVLLTIYLIGVFLFLVRMVYFLYKPIKIICRYGIEKKGKVNLILSDNIHSPFSIFNFIFLNRSHVSTRFLDEVLAHEKVHVAQKHTLDLLFIELLLVFQWFNPVVFLIRKSLQEVHEFLADEAVLQRGFDRSSYIGLILQQVIRKPMMGLVSQFNSLTKKRIVMITKNKTKKKFTLKYLFILPVVSVLFFAFSIDQQSDRGEEPGNFLSSLSNTVEFSWSQDKTTPSVWPIDRENCKFTSGFGERIHPIYREKMMHKGVDLAAAKGTPVQVTADGVVEKTEDWPEGYGKYIVVVHNDIFTTLYAQLSEIKVKVGDRVKQGDVIGLVGSSGLSTAPHLHYEVRKNGEVVNPADYFDIN